MGVDPSVLKGYESEIDAIMRMLDDSFGVLRSGKAPVMNEVAGRVEALCRKVAGADSDTAQEVKPMMGQIITVLDDLAAAIEKFQADLSDEDIPS